jgi:hypothetical protein
MESISPEEALRQFTEWRQRQRDACRKYRETHAEDIKKRKEARKESNPEDVRAKNREYMRRFREKNKQNKSDEKVNE